MICKLLAFYKLAKDNNIPIWLVFMPTGTDCILEMLFEINDVTDDYGCKIDIVYTEIAIILLLAIPIINIFVFIYWRLWRRKILYCYFIPSIFPDINEWYKLLLTIIPIIFYIKVWRL